MNDVSPAMREGLAKVKQCNWLGIRDVTLQALISRGLVELSYSHFGTYVLTRRGQRELDDAK